MAEWKWPDTPEEFFRLIQWAAHCDAVEWEHGGGHGSYIAEPCWQREAEERYGITLDAVKRECARLLEADAGNGKGRGVMTWDKYTAEIEKRLVAVGVAPELIDKALHRKVWQWNGGVWEFMEAVQWAVTAATLKAEGQQGVLEAMSDPAYAKEAATERGITLEALANECVRMGTGAWHALAEEEEGQP